jgi:hypothetical protein
MFQLAFAPVRASGLEPERRWLDIQRQEPNIEIRLEDGSVDWDYAYSLLSKETDAVNPSLSILHFSITHGN